MFLISHGKRIHDVVLNPTTHTSGAFTSTENHHIYQVVIPITESVHQRFVMNDLWNDSTATVADADMLGKNILQKEISNC